MEKVRIYLIEIFIDVVYTMYIPTMRRDLHAGTSKRMGKQSGN